jgi:hypothetical protein
MRGKGVNLGRQGCGRIIKDGILEHRVAKEQIREREFFHWVQDHDKRAESWAGGVTLGIKGYKVTQKRGPEL